MAEEYGSTLQTQSSRASGGRRAEVALLAGLRDAASTGESLLQFAQTHGVPEATMRYWVSRAQQCGAPASFVRFVESPEGLEVLHRIVVAATFVLTQEVGGGVRAVCSFLERSGLWRVVAAGYGTQQEAVKAMEEVIVGFGAEQRAELASTMSPRDITVTQDETFHDEPCLVAIEPVSNFILVEQYASDRQAETWKAVMNKALSGLPVTVIQSTSDEGSSLLSAARDSGAHHSPDLFHPLQDISRATSLPLQRKVEAAERAASEAAQRLNAMLDEAEAYDSAPHGPGRPRDYEGRLTQADEALKSAEAAVKQARERREKVREAARGISLAYHPFDLRSGAPRDATQVERELKVQFQRIDELTAEVGLSPRCRSHFEKARRLLPQMAGTIAFVHSSIERKIETLDLSPEVKDVMRRQLIPASYLEEIERKQPTAEAKAAVRTAFAELKAAVEAPNTPLSGLSPDAREQVQRAARECARIFQRSSSNVEGRNGVLSLRHHSIHELNERKLQALTVVHNYAIRRADGTTPAARFFGRQHRDLFEELLVKLPLPRRPAARRAVMLH